MSLNREELLQTVKEYSDKMINAIKTASEFFQSYDDARGSELMIQIVDGLQWFIEAVVSIEELKNEIDIININDKFKEIVDAFENGDYVLIGDLLQYELLPIIEDINNKIEDVIKI